MNPEFYEDWICPHADPLAKVADEIDFDEMDRRLGWTEPAPVKSDNTATMGRALHGLMRWLIGRKKIGPRSEHEIGRRAIAFALLVFGPAALPPQIVKTARRLRILQAVAEEEKTL